MSHPRWGRIYPLALAGVRSEVALVVSENDYNSASRDVVIVPMYRTAIDASDTRVRIGAFLADCTLVQNIDEIVLGDGSTPCPEEQILRVRLGLRVFLDIDRLLARTPAPEPPERGDWYPLQSDVHYASLPGIGEQLFAIVSENDFNGARTSRHVTGVKLTSNVHGRGWREPIEVPVAGGAVVAAHLYPLPLSTVDERMPRPPRPRSLDAAQMHAIAAVLRTLLKL